MSSIHAPEPAGSARCRNHPLRLQRFSSSTCLVTGKGGEEEEEKQEEGGRSTICTLPSLRHSAPELSTGNPQSFRRSKFPSGPPDLMVQERIVQRSGPPQEDPGNDQYVVVMTESESVQTFSKAPCYNHTIAKDAGRLSCLHALQSDGRW